MAVQIIFYFFSAMLLLSAAMVVVIRNPIHAALFLILSFFSSAVIWLLLYAEFLAIVLVLVYVGAVMVLFLFVVMMLDITLSTLHEGFARYLPIGVMVAVAMAVVMGIVVGSDHFSMENAGATGLAQDNTSALGLMLYTEYLYHFEIAGVILLVAIVAAISLSMHKKKRTKSQSPDDQVSVRKAERLRIVKMSSETGESEK